MPLHFYCKITETIYLGVWRIVETPDYFLKEIHFSKDELENFSKFKSESRKIQWLSCRLLLKKYMNENNERILYNNFGKPYLASGKYISISHTPHFSSVIISEKKAVGIDIEKVTDRILKVKDKFVSEQEMSLIKDDNLEDLTTIWTAKEAIYKVFDVFDLNFRNDIFINVAAENKSIFEGKVSHKQVNKIVSLRRIFVEDHILVYIID